MSTVEESEISEEKVYFQQLLQDPYWPKAEEAVIDRWLFSLHINSTPKRKHWRLQTWSRGKAKSGSLWSDEGLHIACILVLMLGGDSCGAPSHFSLASVPFQLYPSWVLPRKKKVDWSQQESRPSRESDGWSAALKTCC